ncbi:MAG: hypothetical protein Q4F54_00310 [Coriobacteriia bacterium]|nr:hypothetical protein [Coriobacteriia bacterium]
MNASSYIYGAYLNFVTNGGGGGTESVDASAQTGDIVAILVCLLACLMVVAAGLIFGVMYKRSKITCANHSRFGALTQTIINNKIIVAAILAVCVIAIAVGAFTARALADVNDDPEKPAAPPYSQVVANGDASNGEVSVDTIHIVDSYAAQYNKVPEIKSFSINAINGVDALKLGNWHVSIDGFEVYSGPATMNGMDISYFPKNLNTFDIDISADGVSSDVFDQINGVKGLAVEFRVDSFRDVSEIPEAYDVGLTLKENTWESPKSITIAKEAEFKEYIESKG